MEEIIKLFNHERPNFDGKQLYIDHIDMLNNDLLTHQYNKTLNRIGNEKIVYHGTLLRYVNDILTQGFDPSMAGSHMSGHIGKGIYFSDLMCQSIYYQLKEEYTGDEKYFQLIICKVALGNNIILKRTASTVNINLLNGYNSHMTKYDQQGKHGYEYCLFNADQILPYALLHLRC